MGVGDFSLVVRNYFEPAVVSGTAVFRTGSRNLQLQGDSQFIATAVGMLAQRLVSDLIKTPLTDVVFKFTIPGFGVKMIKPGPEIGQFLG